MSQKSNYPPLREIRVTWKSGTTDRYSMAAGLTDQQMLDYYRPGKSFNVGNGPLDHFDSVESCEIIR